VAAVIAPDMEDVDEAGVAARDRLEAGHPLELALERGLVFKGALINDLHRAQGTGEGTRHPDLAIRAATDHAHELVIGHARAFAFGGGRGHSGPSLP
jgi:hypothetical protein